MVSKITSKVHHHDYDYQYQIKYHHITAAPIIITKITMIMMNYHG